MVRKQIKGVLSKVLTGSPPHNGRNSAEPCRSGSGFTTLLIESFPMRAC